MRAAVHFAGSSCLSISTRALIAATFAAPRAGPIKGRGSVFIGGRARAPVRVGAGSGELGAMAGAVEEVREAVLAGASARAAHAPVKVMMRDSTVSDQSTFDPARVVRYLASIVGALEGWESDGVSESRSDDVRRTFARFAARSGGYVLSGHVSVQYHVLLHYRPDARVAPAQKELADVIERLRPAEGGMAEQADEIVARRLREAGYADLDGQNLFEALFNDDRLRESISGEIGGEKEYARLAARRQELFDELDSLLLETYQTSTVLIDEARLVTGEEGIVCAFDLERDSGGSREGHFAQSEIPPGILDWIRSRLAQARDAVQGVNREADAEEGLRGRSGPPDLA